MPEALVEPGSKHWRVMEMTLHVPWFLLTVEYAGPEGEELAMSYTMFIAWDTDLADALKAIDASRVRGLVAMMPAWASATGQWSSRQITEVWLRTDDEGVRVTLKDIAGEKFAANSRGDVPEAGDAGELLLRLPPGEPRKLRPRSAGAGRSRRRGRPSP